MLNKDSFVEKGKAEEEGRRKRRKRRRGMGGDIRRKSRRRGKQLEMGDYCVLLMLIMLSSNVCNGFKNKM